MNNDIKAAMEDSANNDQSLAKLLLKLISHTNEPGSSIKVSVTFHIKSKAFTLWNLEIKLITLIILPGDICGLLSNAM